MSKKSRLNHSTGDKHIHIKVVFMHAIVFFSNLFLHKKRLMGSIMLCLGFALFLFAPLSAITGFTIGESISDFGKTWLYALGLIFILLGGISLIVSNPDHVKVGNLWYDPHALERMEEKWKIPIYPSVIEGVIEKGESYPLAHVKNPEATSGATRVYVGREIIAKKPKSADTREREWLSMLVLTDDRGTIKTVEVNDSRTLRNFMKHYVSMN